MADPGGRAGPGERRRGVTPLDLSSSTLFYRKLDELKVMDPEGESEICSRIELARLDVVRALIMVPSGRRSLLGPLERMGRAERQPVALLDRTCWGMSDGVLPPEKRVVLRQLLSSIRTAGLTRETYRSLHLCWPAVERLARRLHEDLETAGRMLEQLEAAAGSAGTGDERMLESAIRYSDPRVSRARPFERLAWHRLPGLQSARVTIAAIESRTGANLPLLRMAGELLGSGLDSLRTAAAEMLEGNLRLVVKCVRGYVRLGTMEEMDLVQEGCQGLIEAISRFDPARGNRFSTYAVWWIRQSLVRALVEKSRIVRLPATAARRLAGIRLALERASARGEPSPSVEELARDLSTDPGSITALLEGLREPVHMDRPSDEDGFAPVQESLRVPGEGPESEALELDTTSRLRCALELLTERERSIICLRFGLLDGEQHSLDSIARAYGISRERVRKIELRALKRLRECGSFSGAEREGGE
ncbi:sigma-70 family RNA polymerase sigma factor [Candidatus Fermentibacterales bacterium]|nr:sigma-70 family RNA polymerase sigma factor [Candidatus Fermentibacterales bacterium]